MKKNIIIYLLISFIFALTACQTQPVTSTPIPTAEPIPTEIVEISDVMQDDETETETEQEEITYIGNKNTKKFHLPDCHTLPAEKNRVELSSFNEAINMGFVPCKNCIGK